MSLADISFSMEEAAATWPPQSVPQQQQAPALRTLGECPLLGVSAAGWQLHQPLYHMWGKDVGWAAAAVLVGRWSQLPCRYVDLFHHDDGTGRQRWRVQPLPGGGVALFVFGREGPCGELLSPSKGNSTPPVSLSGVHRCCPQSLCNAAIATQRFHQQSAGNYNQSWSS